IEGWRSPDSRREEPDSVMIQLQQRGFCVVSQNGRHTVLNMGDATFCTANEPYSIAVSDHSEMLLLEVPIACLAADACWLSQHSAHLITAKAPALQLLQEFLSSLWRHGPPMLSGPWREQDGESSASLATMLLQLLASALCLRARWDPK